MEVIRKIGNVEILVDCNAPHDIFFEQEFSEKHSTASKELSQIDICNLLSAEKFHPLYLMWEIIDKCNFSCPFCYIVGHSNNKTVRFNEVKNQLDILIEKGLLYCLLTGGESIIHPDFIEIYKHLKKSGVIVEVYSNGAQLTQEHFDTFLEYPPYKIEITIYGLSDSIFKKNTNSKFIAKDTLDNIKKLKELGLNVICKTPVNALTITEFEEIRNWCKVHNIEHYHSSDVSQSYDNKALSQYVAPKSIKLKYEIENEINFIKKHENPKNNQKKLCFSCSVGSYGVHINSKFHLQPCSSFNSKKYGFDIKELGMSNALSKLRDYVLSFHKKPILDCIGCSASTHCKMCPALAEEVLLNGNIIDYKTNSEYCENIRNNYSDIIGNIN